MSVDAALHLVADACVHTVRVLFADQHGVLRGKAVAAAGLASAFERGIGVPASLLHKDTGNTYAIGLWETTGNPVLDSLVGVQNVVLRPDPTTLRVLPWAEGNAVVLCDLETIHGSPITLSTRGLCADAVSRLAAYGHRFLAGLELEFHLFRREVDGSFTDTHPGWDLLGEDPLDRLEPILEPIRRGLVTLGFPPATIEAELGPSQIEITFAPTSGMAVADQAVLVRSAIRQLARRNGLHATFMSRPRVKDESFPSGWHLHQSLVALPPTKLGPDRPDRPDRPAATDVFASQFRPDVADDLLSAVGRHWVAGLLHNAAASCLLTTPTVTGYKRYRQRAVTPDRVTWSREHRGAMLRVVGGPGDPSTRVENRVGDPAANPYLYVASQILSGLDGLDAPEGSPRVPPPPADNPYEPAGGPLLPRSLGEAIEEFDRSILYRSVWGDEAVSYFVAIKRSEWNRFMASVTDWEQREYFERF